MYLNSSFMQLISMSRAVASLLVTLLATSLLPTSIFALSWPLCENGGTVWVTEQPRTAPTFPGANLWFFCEGQLNVLGNSISACVPDQSKPPNTSSICVPQVAEAICQLLGYERSFADDTQITPAAPGEPVITLTGDFCIRKGQYASVLPENFASIPGEPCDKISKLTCIRTLDTMAAAATLGLSRAENLSVLQPTPSAEDLATTAQLAENAATMAQQSGQPTPSGTIAAAGGGTGTSGRKLLKAAA